MNLIAQTIANKKNLKEFSFFFKFKIVYKQKIYRMFNTIHENV